jgi:hypothetical protein
MSIINNTKPLELLQAHDPRYIKALIPYAPYFDIHKGIL